MPPILQKIHESVTAKMADSRFVENVLIAKYRADNGELHDCIYCTIIRVALLFGMLGFLIGLIAGWLL